MADSQLIESLEDCYRREKRRFQWTCLWLAIMAVCAPLGWMLCERKVAQLVAAGAGFEEIDKASDVLFLGVIASFLAGMAFLFCLVTWLVQISKRRNLWQSPRTR